jgi:hypothetical protein
MRAKPLALLACLLPTGLAAADEFKTKTGAFTVSLLSLHRQRDLMLVPGPWVWVDEEGRQRPIEKRTPRSKSSAGPLFQARLRVTVEPKTLFRLDGVPGVTEAIDDLDQSLEAAPEESTGSKRGGLPARGAFSTVDLRLPLSLPDQPGKTIKRLRGVVPVVVNARSREPLAVLPLAESKGRSVTAGDFKLTVLDFKPGDDRSATVSLALRLENEKGDIRDRSYRGKLATRLADIAQQQLEIVDDQTRPVVSHASAGTRRNELRITLRVSPGDSYGAADRLRVFGLARKSIEVPFDFKDVPMP